MWRFWSRQPKSFYHPSSPAQVTLATGACLKVAGLGPFHIPVAVFFCQGVRVSA